MHDTPPPLCLFGKRWVSWRNIAAVINPRGASQSETLEWDRGENFENRLLGPTISARYGRDGHGSPHSLLIVMQAANCDKVH